MKHLAKTLNKDVNGHDAGLEAPREVTGSQTLSAQHAQDSVGSQEIITTKAPECQPGHQAAEVP